MYDNLSVGASRCPALCGEGVLVVPFKGFLKWGMELDLKTKYGRPISVFQVHFCPGRLINYPLCTKAEVSLPNVVQLEANTNAYQSPNFSFENNNIRRTKNGEIAKDFHKFAYVTIHGFQNSISFATSASVALCFIIFRSSGSQISATLYSSS